MKDLLSQIHLPEATSLPNATGGWDRPAARAEFDSDYRAIESLLHKVDPDALWGGLSRTVTSEGVVQHLCRDHVATYTNPAQRPRHV
jgi:hypothetical protein